MTKITVTDDDLDSARTAFMSIARYDELAGKPWLFEDCLCAVVHALAERWSPPTLDPVVTERLGKIIEESKE